MGSRPSPGGGEAAPSPASLGFIPATPMQPSAPLAAHAESGSDPTRVGALPDPRFAGRGEAAPSPALLGFGLATPLPPDAFGHEGRIWAGRHQSGRPATASPRAQVAAGAQCRDPPLPFAQKRKGLGCSLSRSGEE